MMRWWAHGPRLVSSEEVADRMIENVIGTYSLPIGVATNFIIDGEHYLIPFVVEEASVVAAATWRKDVIPREVSFLTMMSRL